MSGSGALFTHTSEIAGMQRYVPVPKPVRQETFSGNTLPFHMVYTYLRCLCQRARTPFIFFIFVFFFSVCMQLAEQTDTYLIWIKDKSPFSLQVFD